MDTKLRNVKGTADILPEEGGVRQGILKVLQETFELYGYAPMETPSLCYFDVLASKYAGGAEILKEVYRLTDQGGRDLGLRYDLTVPFARVIGMNPDIRMPFKRYEIGRVYRDGPVKTGRCREFTQCDVDVVGVKSVVAEAELMEMSVRIFKRLGLDIVIMYNNRKLLSALIQAAGIPPKLMGRVILTVDKLEKIGAEAVKEELWQCSIGKREVEKLFALLNMDTERLLTLDENGDTPLLEEGIRDLLELREYLKLLDTTDKMRFSPTLARGLEIYTGTVWEVFLKDGSLSCSLGAGGRYDNIIWAFLGNGKEYPALGMTFGLDVIAEALKRKETAGMNAPCDLYLIPLGTKGECLCLAAELRKQGVKTDMEMTGCRLKKALEYAGKQRVPYTVILGEDEVKSGVVKLKDMKAGNESEVQITKLAQALREICRREE